MVDLCGSPSSNTAGGPPDLVGEFVGKVTFLLEEQRRKGVCECVQSCLIQRLLPA